LISFVLRYQYITDIINNIIKIRIIRSANFFIYVWNSYNQSFSMISIYFYHYIH